MAQVGLGAWCAVLTDQWFVDFTTCACVSLLLCSKGALERSVRAAGIKQGSAEKYAANFLQKIPGNGRQKGVNNKGIN